MGIDRLARRGGAVAVMLVLACAASAQEVRTDRQSPQSTGSLLLLEGSITGEQSVDYLISAEQSQILSVDLQSSKASGYFTLIPAGSEDAIFVGSTQGNVADVNAPMAGDYVVRVYLMRNAARRNETADYTLAVSVGAPEFADGLSGGPDYWQVSGVGGGDALNVRGGPSTRYAVVGKLNNGDILQNQGCRLSGSDRWCSIRASGSGVPGWVAGRFLVETGAPQAPAVAEGGPVGNGTPFDATGLIPCANSVDQPMRKCPFGVIRSGPGNAGVWVALGNGTERQILFEGGVLVTTGPAGALSFEKSGDLFTIRVDTERYEMPEAVVNGAFALSVGAQTTESSTGSLPPPADQISADCGSPVYATDQLVCSTPELLALDAEMLGLWSGARDLSFVPSYWIEAQSAWFKRRSLCAFRDDHSDCVKAAYSERIAVLYVLQFPPGPYDRAVTCSGDGPFRSGTWDLGAGLYLLMDELAQPIVVAMTSVSPAWTPFVSALLEEEALRITRMDGAEMTCLQSLRRSTEFESDR